MKKHYCVIRDINNELKEVTVFDEMSSRDLKKQYSHIVAVTSTERVKHPSPELLVKVLESIGVNVSEFYELCEKKGSEDI